MSFRSEGWSWFPAALLLSGVIACGPAYIASQGGDSIVLRGDAVIPWGEAGGLRCVPDVPAALKRLERYGATLGFHLGSAEPVGGLRRHWQGVQRSVGSNGTHLFVSRSGSRTAVLVATLGSGSGGGGALGPSLLHPENVADGEAPPYADRVVTRIPFDSGFNHAGGLALSGTVLAVPMDGGGRSQVAFYDMSLPAQPRRLGVLDHSDAPRYSTPSQASAVALGRLADGRNLLILGVKSSKILEFYVSDRESLLAPGFAFHRLGIRLGQNVLGFQNLSLLTQCDGRMYLVGTHNTALPPPSKGRDHVHWYRLETDSSGRILLIKEGERWLHCAYCNLAAAAGLYVTPTGEVLLYATGFWTRSPGAWVVVEEFGPALQGRNDP